MAPAGGSRLGRGAYVKSTTKGRASIAFLIDNIPLCAPKVAYVNSGER